MHAGYFFELILGELWLEPLPFAEFAGVNHFAVEFEGIVNDRVEESLTLYVVVIVVSASTSENQVRLQKQRQHVIERRLLRKPIDPLMKYLLRLLI